jgi:rhamnosyltransferase
MTVHPKVAGVVVLFNPEESILENIDSYINQVGKLFVVDNSLNQKPFIQVFARSKNNLEYIYNGDNIGVAAALNIGVKKAIESGYAFLLTMDQDSKAPQNLVSELLKVIETDKRIGIVSPLHSNKFDTHLKKQEKITQEMIVMTSGNLLSLDVCQKIGTFRQDFFIDYVDIEYCIRMNYNNYKVLKVNNIILEHNEGNLSEKKFLFWTFYPSNNPPTRLYYKTRNLLFLRDIYKRKFPQPLKSEYDAYLRNVAKIILLEKQKFLKFKMILNGVMDYLKKKKGREF